MQIILLVIYCKLYILFFLKNRNYKFVPNFIKFLTAISFDINTHILDKYSC